MSTPLDVDDSAPPRWRRWLVRDWVRVVVAIVAMTVVMVIDQLRVGLEHQNLTGLVVRTARQVLVGWIVFAAVHTLTTVLAYAGLSGAQVRAIARAERVRRQRQPGWLRRPTTSFLMTGGDAPAWAIQLSLCALVGVAAVAFSAALREAPWVLALAGVLTAASWVNVLVVYAVSYALADARQPGMDFPGEADRGFSDFLYFSAMVQSTFGTTDVAVTTTPMRRMVTAHGLLAFVYNTFVVAMLISVMLTR